MSLSRSSSNGGAPTGLSDGGRSPYLEHAETSQRLLMTQKRKSQTEQELRYLQYERSSTPLSPVEITAKDQQIYDLNLRLQGMELQILQFQQQLQHAEATIIQQQATIRNQSKAIEDPRQARDAGGAPRRRQGPDSNAFGSGHRPSAPTAQSTYDIYPGQEQQRTAPGAFGLEEGMSSMLLNAHSGPRVDEFGSPQRVGPPRPPPQPQPPSLSANGSFTNINDPFASFARQAATGQKSLGVQAHVFQPTLPTPANSRAGSSLCGTLGEATSSALVTSTSAGCSTSGTLSQETKESFDTLFRLANKYAMTHLNFPSTAGDGAVPDELKHRLLKAATSNTAFLLMSKTETRYWLITKIVIQWIIKHVLRPNTFSGLDREVDQIIDGTRANIYQSTPAVIRYLSLKNVAHEISKITQHQHFSAFREHLIKQRTQQLYWTVRPLKNRQTLRDEQDLEDLVRHAHELAVLMYTSTDEYRFEFAEVGQRFDRFTMINVDPKLGRCTDDDMRARFAKVKLGATPEIVVRKNNEQGNVVELKMHKGRVLLQVKDQQE